MARKLTIKQKKFADEYIISGNATEASLKAGYSPKTARAIGYENLTKPYIKSYIEDRMDALAGKAIAEQEEVLQYLTSVMRGEETEKTLLGVGKGEQAIVEIDVSAKDRLKAAELLGKRYALFTDKQELDADLTLSVEVDYG